MGDATTEIGLQISYVTYQGHFETEKERKPSQHNLPGRLHTNVYSEAVYWELQ
jgi:hypothetical protein